MNGRSRMYSSADTDGKLTAFRMMPSLQKIAQRGGRLDADQLLPLARRRGDVGRRHDLGQLLQTRIEWRLRLEDVERGAATWPDSIASASAFRRSGRRGPC